MVDVRQIYFSDADHKYTDQFGNVYISTTQYNDQFFPPFDVETKARQCAGTKNYRGMNPQQIKDLWAKWNKESLAKGNFKHDYLENTITNSNGYNKVKSEFINNRIYTITDVLSDPRYGVLELEDFIKTGINDRYPSIFEYLRWLTNNGYKIYAEVGVYWYKWLLSGRIDCIAINFNTKEFIIVDWKTNKHELRFEAGYYKKDQNRNPTDEFVSTNKKMYYPLGDLPCSDGNKYSLQLTCYANLVEQYGLKCKLLVLFHIRELTSNGKFIREEITPYNIRYMLPEWNKLVYMRVNSISNRNTQLIIDAR